MQGVVDPHRNDLVQRQWEDKLTVNGVESPESEADKHPDGKGETRKEEILGAHQSPTFAVGLPSVTHEVVYLQFILAAQKCPKFQPK